MASIALVVSLMISLPVMAGEELECGVLPQFLCSNADNPELGSSGIWFTLIMIINILTAGVGIVAVGMITYAGFLYSSAQGNTEQVKKAMTMIRNAVIGLIAFALMFTAANYLIPGGIFGAGGNEQCTPGEPC